LRRRRRRESGHGRPPAGDNRGSQKTVVGPKVMSPGGDAVRFVNDHTVDVQLGQSLHETWAPKSLGRQEQQTVLAPERLAKAIDLLGPLHGGIDEGRRDSSLGK